MRTAAQDARKRNETIAVATRALVPRHHRTSARPAQSFARCAWDRLEKESAISYAYFLEYRDQPEMTRSHDSVAKAFKRSLILIRKSAAKFDWSARAKAWDMAKRRARDDNYLQSLADLGRKHAMMARVELETLMQPAREFARRLAEGTIDIHGLGDVQLIRLAIAVAPAVAAMIEIERTIAGQGQAADESAAAIDASKRDTEVAKRILLDPDARAKVYAFLGIVAAERSGRPVNGGALAPDRVDEPPQ